ncbi:hypothetical protein BS78_01G390000 [Paspalum vaginatum]|nr:hypothetical protein BS78_01G390000 [Paspalum vaginatum]
MTRLGEQSEAQPGPVASATRPYLGGHTAAAGMAGPRWHDVATGAAGPPQCWARLAPWRWQVRPATTGGVTWRQTWPALGGGGGRGKSVASAQRHDAAADRCVEADWARWSGAWLDPAPMSPDPATPTPKPPATLKARREERF